MKILILDLSLHLSDPPTSKGRKAFRPLRPTDFTPHRPDCEFIPPADTGLRSSRGHRRDDRDDPDGNLLPRTRGLAHATCLLGHQVTFLFGGASRSSTRSAHPSRSSA